MRVQELVDRLTELEAGDKQILFVTGDESMAFGEADVQESRQAGQDVVIVTLQGSGDYEIGAEQDFVGFDDDEDME